MIKLIESTHTYINDVFPECKYTSITTILGKYHKPYDSDFFAEKVALREGVTKEEILERWDQIKNEANELVDWAEAHKDMFKDYDLDNEPEIISSIGDKFPKFNDQKKEGAHADPWLVAQAKNNNIVVITQETPGTDKIPTVCRDFDIGCVSVIGFLRAENIVI